MSIWSYDVVYRGVIVVIKSFAQSNTSRHLQMMLKAGVLNQRKDGLKIYYSVRHAEVLEMVRLAEQVAAHEARERAALFSA